MINLRMGYGLELTQSQKLVMTPQLKQAITVLQLNSIELDTYVKEHMEGNPVLELTEVKEKPLKEKEEKDINWKEYIEDFDNHHYTPNQYSPDRDDFNYENVISKEATLHEHLLSQYNMTRKSSIYPAVGEYIIHNLDENGYLSMSLEQISEDLNTELEVVEEVLSIIQTFDPPGVGARDLKESLLIQLNLKEITDPRMFALVEDHLEKIASNKFPDIAKALQIPVAEVQTMCDYIRSLEPRPGRQFINVQNKYITPDVIVKDVEGEYVVVYNESSVPRLYIREDYRKMVLSEQSINCEDTKKYINDKLNAALWLIKNIEQRKQTIYRGVENIIDRQKDFFEKGKRHLKPLTLREVAEDIDVHESTVSRATNGKYVQTPVGTFELKFFFSSGIETREGNSLSSNSIKDFIREMIEKENPHKPLSDEKIAKQLELQGMKISRRTVAKYRDDLGLLSSSKRKRYE